MTVSLNHGGITHESQALLWLKRTAAALHVFFSHGSGARSGSRLALLIGGGNTWIWLLGCDIHSVWRGIAFVVGQSKARTISAIYFFG